MRKRFYFAYNKCVDLSMPGLVFMPYIMVNTTKVICDPSFSSKVNLRSRYALAEVNPIYYGNIIDNNGAQDNS